MLAALHTNPLQQQMLALLARLRFATAELLVSGLPVEAMSSVRRCAQRLEQARLVEINTDLKPFVYRLSRLGCQLMGQRYFRTWHSVAAMHQVLLRNQIELLMQQEDHQASVANRTQLLSLGLHAAQGEHAFILPNISQLFRLVVIDDYWMQSDRIVHKWHRPHLRQSQKVGNTSLKRWCDVCGDYRIYTISERQQQAHRLFLANSGFNNLSMKASVHLINPIWGVSH